VTEITGFVIATATRLVVQKKPNLWTMSTPPALGVK
jgi:hypothetical protein